MTLVLVINPTPIKRNKLGQFARNKKRYEAFGVALAFIIPVMVSAYDNETQPVRYEAQTSEVSIEEEYPKEIRIEVEYNWDKERIQDEVRKLFPENPERMLAILKCESNYVVDAVGPTSDFGLFQIHYPTWHSTAIELGYADYATNPYHNLQMARYIYDVQGINAWVCNDII